MGRLAKGLSLTICEDELGWGELAAEDSVEVGVVAVGSVVSASGCCLFSVFGVELSLLVLVLGEGVEGVLSEVEVVSLSSFWLDSSSAMPAISSIILAADWSRLLVVFGKKAGGQVWGEAYLEGLGCDFFGERRVHFVGTAGIGALDGHGGCHDGQEEAEDEEGETEAGHCGYDDGM